jgi:putative membrane protein
MDQNKQNAANSGIESDVEFAVEAANGGMLEVKLGELAHTNGSTQSVKDFGKMMITDHTKAGDELKALAQRKNITLPSALSNKSQHEYDKLAKKTGHEFDKEYIDLMVEDHKGDINEFEEEASEGKDPDIKNWAASALPVLRHHLDAAKSTNDAVK